MPNANATSGKGIVLVIDDELLLRMMAIDLVEEAGFEAIEAADADEAIRILESRDDIRIIFTDIDMPAGSMNGLKLAAAVRRRWPPIEIIIVSGHYQVTKEDLPERSVFFGKPYSNDAIIAQLGQFAVAD